MLDAMRKHIGIVGSGALLLLGCGGGEDRDVADGDASGSDAAVIGDAGSPAADADPAVADADTESAADASGAESRIIFATSSLHAGDLGGFEGADGICEARAAEAGLEGTFRAWLSTGEVDAPDRLDPAPGALVRTDGEIVVASWDALVGGSLQNPISLDEHGDPIFGDVWTGTTADGSSAADHCEGFTAGSGPSTGLCGNSGATDGSWTENIVPACGTTLRLYCVEQ